FLIFSSRRRHTRSKRDWSSDVCSSDLSRAVTRLPSRCSSVATAPPKRPRPTTRTSSLCRRMRGTGVLLLVACSGHDTSRGTVLRMSTQACAVWGEDFTRYDFGVGHPMSPVRLDLTARLCRELGVFDEVELLDGDVADHDQLTTVHDRDYIEAVRAASAHPAAADGRWGIGTEDVPAFADMHDSSARVVAGSVECARRVWTGAN